MIKNKKEILEYLQEYEDDVTVIDMEFIGNDSFHCNSCGKDWYSGDLDWESEDNN